MSAVLEWELSVKEASAPVEVPVTGASAAVPSSEILGIAAQLRAARLTSGDRTFLFCPACDTKHPGSFAEQVAHGLMHLDGPSVLVIHLYRSQHELDSKLATSPYATRKELLTESPHPVLRLAYPMQGDNTAALVSSEFSNTMTEARKQFKYVLVDCPPLQKQPTALLLAPEIGGTIFTVPAGRARQMEAQTACNALRRAGAKLMGFVLIPG